MRPSFYTGLLALSSLAGRTMAIDVTVGDDDSIKKAAAAIAKSMLGYYTGMNPGDVPGNLPDPYFWWEAGGMFGTLVDYWYFTGDSSYNNITLQAMVHQTGDDHDFMPKNQTKSEGNDDQGFWALSAMNAAEQKFVDPPTDGPQWTSVVQAVFNEYVSRWEEATCGGGLRWQIASFMNGWDYKNSVANGCFFNLAARLGRYTGNETYNEWATKIWDWQVKTGLITDEFAVLDGAHIDADSKKCVDVDKLEWSYNSGLFLHGAAAMYNQTESDTWKKRVDGILAHSIPKFSKNGVIYEQFCEPQKNCDLDQQSFKGYYARFLSATSLLAPHLATQIWKLLDSTAPKAAAACTGTVGDFRGTQGQACGFTWQGGFDGTVGVGEQMNVLSSLMYTLTKNKGSPVTLKTGGTSKSDPNAGVSDSHKKDLTPITTADRAGAGILTTLMLLGLMGYCGFLVKN